MNIPRLFLICWHYACKCWIAGPALKLGTTNQPWVLFYAREGNRFQGRRRISQERGAMWDGEALRSASAAQFFWLPLVLFVLPGSLRFPSFLSAVPNHHRQTFLFPGIGISISWKSTFCDMFPVEIFSLDSEEHWTHVPWLNLHHYSHRYVGSALC